jgi:hypothetical protein
VPNKKKKREKRLLHPTWMVGPGGARKARGEGEIQGKKISKMIFTMFLISTVSLALDGKRERWRERERE